MTENFGEHNLTGLKQPPAMREDGNMAVNWKDWKTSFDYYMVASGKEHATAREKCALFLHIIGERGRDALDELDLNINSDYETLVSKFELYFNPPQTINNERYLFFETYQCDSKFDDFFYELKTKSKMCDFGDLRNCLILTQIIRGLRDEKVRDFLLLIPKLHLEETLAWCRAAECAKTKKSSLNVNHQPDNIKKTSVRQQTEENNNSGDNVSRKESVSVEDDYVIQQMEITDKLAESLKRRSEDSNYSFCTSSNSLENPMYQMAEDFVQLRETSNQKTGPQRPARPWTTCPNTFPLCKVNNCDYCGDKHSLGEKCLAWDAICYRCERIGHFERMCREPRYGAVCTG